MHEYQKHELTNDDFRVLYSVKNGIKKSCYAYFQNKHNSLYSIVSGKEINDFSEVLI